MPFFNDLNMSYITLCQDMNWFCPRGRSFIEQRGSHMNFLFIYILLYFTFYFMPWEHIKPSLTWQLTSGTELASL